MRVFVASVLLAFAVAAFVPQADAAPITYQISAVASGQIGATSFTNALVTFTGTGNTNDIQAIFSGLFYAEPLATLTVLIEGVGTATLTDPTAIYGVPVTIPDSIDTDNELPDHPFVLIGRVDNPPALDGFTGIAAVASDSLSGYKLDEAAGPITALGGVGFIQSCSTPGHDPCLGTSKGLLSFTSNIIVENGGTFTARLVPEPASVILLGGGLAAFIRRSRRGKRA